MSLNESEKARILERVQKMLRLAADSGASEGERDNAMRMAHATLAKYNLDLAMAEKHRPAGKNGAQEEDPADPRGATPVTFFGRPWARSICMAAADLCFCEYLYVPAHLGKDTRHYFIGRQSNATTAAYLAEYLVDSVHKEGRRRQRAQGERNPWFISFAWGAGNTIWERVRELRAATAQERPANSTPGTDLVLASVYDNEREKNKRYVALNYKTKERGTTGQGVKNAQGWGAGKEYGKGLNLSRQVR